MVARLSAGSLHDLVALPTSIANTSNHMYYDLVFLIVLCKHGTMGKINISNGIKNYKRIDYYKQENHQEPTLSYVDRISKLRG